MSFGRADGSSGSLRVVNRCKFRSPDVCNSLHQRHYSLGKTFQLKFDLSVGFQSQNVHFATAIARYLGASASYICYVDLFRTDRVVQQAFQYGSGTTRPMAAVSVVRERSTNFAGEKQ